MVKIAAFKFAVINHQITVIISNLNHHYQSYKHNQHHYCKYQHKTINIPLLTPLVPSPSTSLKALIL